MEPCRGAAWQAWTSGDGWCSRLLRWGAGRGGRHPGELRHLRHGVVQAGRRRAVHGFGERRVTAAEWAIAMLRRLRDQRIAVGIEVEDAHAVDAADGDVLAGGDPRQALADA